MGWLRALMGARTPPLHSYGELARGLLGCELWPPEFRTKARSLEAILGKLDRDLELDWLAERPQVQLALAQVLDCPLGDVRARVRLRHGGPASAEPRVRFDDLPFARSLDLPVEPLCPGFPPSVLDPAEWNALWWVAPAGSGRTLAGRWLAARGLARHCEATRDTDLQSVLGQTGPLFVEVRSDVEDRLLYRPSLPTCIAAPFRPTSARWQIVESPPAGSYADALVDWVAARVPDDGRFDAAAVKRWLARGPLRANRLITLGELLGLCGALDELGSAAAEARTALELGRHFFRARVQRLEQREGRDLGWLRRNGFGVLVGLARRLLTDSDDGWDAPRELETWLELVPPEHQRDPDLGWVQASFAEAELALEARALERAARRLPPGAFRLVRELQDAQLLVQRGAGGLALRPRWLGTVLVGEAAKDLARGSPLELGEALLRPQSAEAVAGELEQRFARGDLGGLQDVLELETDDDPAHVAALEAIVTITGLSILRGAEVAQDLIEELFSEQVRLLADWSDRVPSPRVLHPRAPPGSLLHRGTWLLALLALGEQLPRGRGIPHPLLRQWHASAAHPQTAELYDRVSEALAPGPSWLGAAYGLIDRLRAAIGPSGPVLHPLERPGAVLEEYQVGVSSFATARDLDRTPHGMTALAGLALSRGVPWQDVAAALWAAWADEPTGVDGLGVLAPGSPARELVWPHVTRPALRALARLGVELPFGSLRDDAWDVILSGEVELTPVAERRMWEEIPEPTARLALARSWPQGSDALARCWARFPELALEHVADALSHGRSDALSALVLAPDELTPALVPILSALPRDALSAVELDALRSWAHARIGRRAPGWHAAYALLSACEKELWRLRLLAAPETKDSSGSRAQSPR